MPPAWIVFDTECATARGAPHLLEIGAVRIVEGEAAEHFQALVRPEVPVDSEVTEVHGIDDAMVRDARPAPEVIADFVRFIGDDWLVAHDARRDALVLGFEAARHALELPATPIVDTLTLARRCVPDAADHRLETLAAHFDIDIDAQHRALPDAVTCWRVLEECLEVLARDTAVPDADALMLEMRAYAGIRTTLASSRPRTPRLPPRLRPLAAACAERSCVTLVYGEDVGPAHIRVTPRILYAFGAKGYLEAECARSGTIKTYRLDRVQRILLA